MSTASRQSIIVSPTVSPRRDKKRDKTKQYLKVLFHLIAVLHFWSSCYYDWNYTKVPESIHRMGKTFGKTNKLKFLTFWDALLQAVFFTIALLNDLIGTNENFPEKTSWIRKIKDTVFASLAFPLALFVGTTFWALYLIDRELVLPRALDPYFPFWLNHCMHTNIMLFILIELYTIYRRYPAHKVCIPILSVFMLSYLVWIHVIHAYTGMWVYPVLDVLNLPMRVVFFVGLLMGALGLYFVGGYVNVKVWRSTEVTHAREERERSERLAAGASGGGRRKSKRRRSKGSVSFSEVNADKTKKS